MSIVNTDIIINKKAPKRKNGKAVVMNPHNKNVKKEIKEEFEEQQTTNHFSGFIPEELVNNSNNSDRVKNDTIFCIKNIINSSISCIATNITARGKSFIQYYTSGWNELLIMCKIYVGLLIISEIKYIVN